MQRHPLRRSETTMRDYDSVWQRDLQVNQQKGIDGVWRLNDAKCLQLKHLLPILTKHLFPSQVMATGEAYWVMWHHRNTSVFLKRVWNITRNSLWCSQWLWLTDWLLSLLRGLRRWLWWRFWWGRHPRGRRWSGWYRRHSMVSIWLWPQDANRPRGWFAPTNGREKDQSETPLHTVMLLWSLYMFGLVQCSFKTAMQARTLSCPNVAN